MKKIFLKAIIFIFLLSVFISSFSFLTKNDLLSNALEPVNIRDVNNPAVKLDILVSEWCKVCNELKKELPVEIYKYFSENEVYINFWDNAKTSGVNYFDYLYDKANIPKELKGFVPMVVINEEYYYAGYSKDSKEKMMADIEAIVQHRPVPYGNNITTDVATYYSEKRGIKDVFVNQYTNKIKDNLGMVNSFSIGVIDFFSFINLLLFLTGYIIWVKKSFRELIITIALLALGIFMAITINLRLGHLFISSHLSLMLEIILYLLTIFIVFKAFWIVYLRVFYSNKKVYIKETWDEKLLANLIRTKNYIIILTIGFLFTFVGFLDESLIFKILKINTQINLTSFNVLLYSFGMAIIPSLLLIVGYWLKQHVITEKAKKINTLGLIFYFGLLIFVVIKFIIFLNS